MKVTTKGRVTIPRQIREQLGIIPGTHVDFTVEGDGVVLTPRQVGLSAGERLVQHMRGRGTVKMSTDEILALTRGE